jgi:RNA-directed DNA polymerase
MLRSRSNTLVSVRQVTQRNAGRMTAGIDEEVALTSSARADVAVRVHQSIRSWQPLAVKRVYIPKSGSSKKKLRPLGIPVIMDRCHQNRAKNALEPEWEARFEARSYGFRPGRSCQDAVKAIHISCKGPRAKRVWALDADLAAAFDRIDQTRLLEAIGDFPDKGMIAGWLRAGVFEKGKGFAPTAEGTPQGGLCVAAHKPVPGYPLNRSNAGQRRARVSRETRLFQSVTSANVGRSGWALLSNG